MVTLNSKDFFQRMRVLLKKEKDPVGRDNDKWILLISKKVDLCIGAWGNDGQYLDRSTKIKQLVTNLYCLKVNSSGEPAHPLYLKASLKPVRFI